jgi:acyl-CoA thioester hydrolase
MSQKQPGSEPGLCDPLPSALVSQTFSLNVRIYYADTDAGGVVYHSNYLTLAERARTEALRSAGRPHADLLSEHDCLFMVRRVEVEYLRPARLDDMLTITTEFLDETAATVSARQAFVHADGSICARLRVELVCVRASTGKPARTPLRWRIATAHADRLKT